VTISLRESVAALDRVIARIIGEPRYKLWFDGHTKLTWDGGVLTVGVPNRHFEEWLQKRFHDVLTAAAREVFGQPTEIRFVIDPELFRAARRRNRGQRTENHLRLAARRRRARSAAPPRHPSQLSKTRSPRPPSVRAAGTASPTSLSAPATAWPTLRH
jgi:chromosomal replication initiation ATPase DnaA